MGVNETLFKGRLGRTRPPSTDIVSDSIAMEINMTIPSPNITDAEVGSTHLSTVPETLQWFVRDVVFALDANEYFIVPVDQSFDVPLIVRRCPAPTFEIVYSYTAVVAYCIHPRT